MKEIPSGKKCLKCTRHIVDSKMKCNAVIYYRGVIIDTSRDCKNFRARGGEGQ